MIIKQQQLNYAQHLTLFTNDWAFVLNVQLWQEAVAGHLSRYLEGFQYQCSKEETPFNCTPHNFASEKFLFVFVPLKRDILVFQIK